MRLDLRQSLTTKLWQEVRAETAGFLASFQIPEVPQRGLHFYDIDLPNGRSLRIHLRVEPSGNGVLFVDVTDVVHLNQTATLMSKMALDGVPRYAARARLAAWFTGASRAQLERELTQIYDMIDGFRHPSADCPTCQLSDTVEMSPMFSIEVNAPYKVDLALTYGCNNECPHCSVWRQFPTPPATCGNTRWACTTGSACPVPGLCRAPAPAKEASPAR